MKYPIFLLFFGALTLASLAPEAHANIADVAGFGSRTSALGGAGVAGGQGAFSAYTNPAALGVKRDKKLQLGWGLVWGRPVFKSITGVTVENEYTSDKERTDNVDTEYRDTLGQTIGASIVVFPEFHNLTFGASIFMPIPQLAYLDTGEPFVPEYVLYRARTQRPQIELGLGGQLSSNFNLGLGAKIAYSLTGDAFVFLQTSAATTSSMRFSASIKPKIVPFLGLYYSSAGNESAAVTEEPVPGSWTAGLVVRMPAEYANNLTLQSGARAFGDFAALDFGFAARSTMFYDPWSAELGFSFQHNDVLRTFLQVDYQNWAGFKLPALSIEDPEIENCEGSSDPDCGNQPNPVLISASSNPAPVTNDLLVPRIGEEIRLGSHTFRVGYSFRKSIFSSLPEGAGNSLDPDRHTITVGYGRKMENFLGFDTPYRLDFHVSFAKLVDQTIVKTADDEAGTATAGTRKIGAPGYTAGGEIWGGGLTLSLAF